MAVTNATTTDVSQALKACLADISGLRVEAYVADKARPPVAIIPLPLIDWQDPEAGFCWAAWEYPIAVVTSRANDQEAQAELAQFVRDVAWALDHADLSGTGLALIQLLDARPQAITLNGQELPGYIIRVRVHA